MPRRFALVLLMLAAVRCSCDETPGLPAGSPCSHSSDCATELVCAAASKACTGNVACTTSAECGLGARCAGGVCGQNTSGGPCATTGECIAGEVCRSDGLCAEPGGRGDPCARADECESGLVCDPASAECDDDVDCTMNSQCGPGAICSGGTCEQNVPGGPCTTDSECVSGEACIGGTCVEGCGGELYSADSVPPNLLIVLDRSGSMNDEIGGDSKWNIARNAIYNFFSTYAGQIRFGLSLYPGTDQSCDQGMTCGPGFLTVPIGPGTEPAIEAYLMGAGTCSFRTPTAEELGILIDYPGLEDTMRANYILLITDGMANCEDPVPVVTALRNQMPEIKTFVVGFGGEVDPQQLTDMAVAGGTERAGTPAYYQADDAASLRNAFATIAGSVLSCEYTLSAVPPDPDQLYVFLDGRLVARDPMHGGGWDHETGTNRLTFYGATCDDLQSGRVTDLVIVYGCPDFPPPGRPDGGPPDGGGGGDDGGIDPTGMGCTSCTQCGALGCVIPPGASSGTCAACQDDFDCCLGYICQGGTCVPNL
jgi:hypothetical protein